MRKLLLVGMAWGGLAISAQDARDMELAHQLASENTQRAAAEAIAALGQAKVPLLLVWVQKPPFPLDEVQSMIFRAGLADAFGALKAKDAVPFLIENIEMRRSPFTLSPWKTPDTIVERLPAVAALMKIGPDALKTILDAPFHPMEPDQRLARVFVVSRIAATIQDKSKAIAYLRSASGEGHQQACWADEALQFVGVQ